MAQDIPGKQRTGKPMIRMVPPQINRDIAEVREYGNEKYQDPDNWKDVPLEDFVDAFLRHVLDFMDDWRSVAADSKIKHYKHMACNLAFICEKLKAEEVEE